MGSSTTNGNGEFRGAVKAEIKGLVDDVKYIRERVDNLPCAKHLERLAAVETKVKTHSTVFGSIAGVITSTVTMLLKGAVGK